MAPLRVKLLKKDARLPTRGSNEAAGYDLYAIDECVIHAGNRAILPIGISIQLPHGTYGRIAPRSGLAVKNGIQVGAGVVDPDYTGELKVVLFNHDKNAYVIRPGYRIAQLILEVCSTPPVQEIKDLEETERGEGGFGSTGITENMIRA